MEHVIALCGDIYNKRSEPTKPFREVPIEDAHFAFANLEGAMTTVPETSRYRRPWNPGNGTGFRMNPNIVEDLKPFTAFSVANNHAFDFTADGYLQSIATLDKAGIPHAGGGTNLAEARKPVVREKEGLTVGFLAYSCTCVDNAEATEDRPGMAKIKIHTAYEMPLRGFEQPGSPAVIHTLVDEASQQDVVSDIKALRDSVDVLVVSFHWGVNGNRSPIEYQKQLGRLSVGAGADAVFGHHPHVLQPIEIYKGRPICYSMGNLLFDGARHSFDGRTAIVRVYIKDKKVDRIGVVPLWPSEERNPVACSPQAAQEIVEGLFPEGAENPQSGTWNDREYVVTIAD